MERKEKEEFKMLAIAMKPIIEEMWAVLKEHKVEDLASVTMSTDGYVAFSHHGTTWDMIRYQGESDFIIRNNLQEVI